MGNLIQTIGKKIKQGYEWLKTKAKPIIEKIQGWYDRYKQRRQRLKDHREYIDSVLDSSLEYTPENVMLSLEKI